MRYAAILVMVMGLPGLAGAEPITTGSLLDELVDLHRLTYFPQPVFKTIQYSSHDRQSDVPGGKAWFANSDGFGKERTPNFQAVLQAPETDAPGEYLMCDVSGPGAIVRLWTAQIGGIIRMYLDDDGAPVYEGPAEDFFLRPYDAYIAGTDLTHDMLRDTLYQRTASYAPIPFAKRCRIVWIGDHREIHFYEIQIRQYPEGTEVVTFSPQDLAANAGRIRNVTTILSKPQEAPAGNVVPVSVQLDPRATEEGLEIKEPGALEQLVLRVDAPDRDLALRQTVMHIICDQFPWGQVQAPVGDFFGAGPGVNPYHSLPFTVAPDGTMSCRFVMPFKESVRILFENRSDQQVTITGAAHQSAYDWDDASSMHFRARWRIDHDLVASNREWMGVQDLPFLLGRGQGVYVGTAVMLLNPNPIPTSWGNWWGEGDEKIFVDDDVLPSTFGTGSEDYFNYAWSANDIFVFPYCGQPRNDGPANRGFVVNYRWHIVDPLPFTSSIAFYMELFSHEPTDGFSYGRISYHYARPGFIDDHVTLTGEDLRRPELPATWEPRARFGAAKFEFYACEDLAGSMDHASLSQGGLWQGGRLLVWTPANAGDELTLSLDIAETGDHTVLLACMLRPDGGAFRATLNGNPVTFDGKETTTLVAPHHVQSRMFGAQLKGLEPGRHDLTIIATDANKPIGLDFLGIRRQ